MLYFKNNIFYILLISLFVFLTPNYSDYEGYRSYYSSTNLSNFSQYSFDIGYTFICAVSNSLNIPFFFFWKISNLLCVLAFFYFFSTKRNFGNFNFSSLIIFSFIIFYPGSQNLFSNIIRNTLAISMCLYILSKRLPLYYYFIPLLFHISSIIFIFSVLVPEYFKKRNQIFILLSIFILLPVFAVLFKNEFISFFYELTKFRSIGNALSAEYYPSYRYLSYLLYFNVMILYLYISYHLLNGKLINYNSKLYYDLSLKNILTLYLYFSSSLFFYWLLYGVGTTSRILTFPVWIGNALLFSLVIKSFVNIYISSYLRTPKNV